MLKSLCVRRITRVMSRAGWTSADVDVGSFAILIVDGCAGCYWGQSCIRVLSYLNGILPPREPGLRGGRHSLHASLCSICLASYGMSGYQLIDASDFAGEWRVISMTIVLRTTTIYVQLCTISTMKTQNSSNALLVGLESNVSHIAVTCP